jgi:hypothetical protein
LHFVSKHLQHPASSIGRSTRGTLAAIALSAVLTAVLWGWQFYLLPRAEALSVEVGRLDAEWATISPDLDEARRAQPIYEAFLDRARSVGEEGDGKSWTPALRSIAVSGGAGIELRQIHIAEKSDHSRACRLDIAGIATGSAPRAVADKFLRTLQDELGRQFQAIEPCQFERLEDETDLPAANPDQRRATFTITTTIGLTAPAKAESGK